MRVVVGHKVLVRSAVPDVHEAVLVEGTEGSQGTALYVRSTTGCKMALGAHPGFLPEKRAWAARRQIDIRPLTQHKNIVQHQMLSVWQGVLQHRQAHFFDGPVPAGNRLRATAHREAAGLVIVCPDVMTLEAIDAKIPGQSHQIRELSDIGFEKRHLQGDATVMTASGRMGVTHGDKGLDVFKSFLPATAEHDAFIGGFRCAVPGNFDIRSDWDDAFGPGPGAQARKRPVGGQVEFDAMRSADVEDLCKVLVEQGLAHGGGDDLAQSMGDGLGHGSLQKRDGHGDRLGSCLFGAEGGMLFAHDAAEIAQLRVCVEGYPPGPFGWRAGFLFFSVEQIPIDGLDLSDLLGHGVNITGD